MPIRPISDTHPTMEHIQLELLRKAPAWQKAHMVGQMYLTMKALALVGLRQRYPYATEAELQRHLANLILGQELAAKVYGPMPMTRITHAD